MKKIILIVSLFVAGVGAAYSQASAIWKPYDINVDTSWCIRYMSAVDSNTVWAIAYNGTYPTASSNIFVKTGNGSVFTKGFFVPDTNTYSPSNIIALDSMTAYVACFVTASDGAAGNPTGISSKIVKTVDGGVHWTNASDSLTMFNG